MKKNWENSSGFQVGIVSRVRILGMLGAEARFSSFPANWVRLGSTSFFETNAVFIFLILSPHIDPWDQVTHKKESIPKHGCIEIVLTKESKKKTILNS